MHINLTLFGCFLVRVDHGIADSLEINSREFEILHSGILQTREIGLHHGDLVQLALGSLRTAEVKVEEASAQSEVTIVILPNLCNGGVFVVVKFKCDSLVLVEVDETEVVLTGWDLIGIIPYLHEPISVEDSEHH